MKLSICLPLSVRLAIDRCHLFGRKTGGENDLKHFDVIAVAELAVPNVWWLMHARARFKSDNALALILELNPALEDVHQLKIRLMGVRLTGELFSGR